MKACRSVVTGGAGFIGSHLTEKLLADGSEVIVVDNFSSGRIANIKHLMNNPLLRMMRSDLKKPRRLRELFRECDVIFHLAANPEVRVSETSTRVHFEENILATFNLLEALRLVDETKIVVLASTSTVYGDARQIPTPETYGPLEPISTYGASKLSCEALLASYANTFSHRGLILRLANIIGPKSNHGVIVDFVRKIRSNPKCLEILGNGTQTKSYLHITDCIQAISHLTDRFFNQKENIDICNVGSEDQITVREIAKIVAREMGTPDIRYVFTRGVNGGRGWRGDVKNMRLSIKKIVETGWKPRYTSKKAVELTAADLSKII
jgi:UDP-glucose 4-epimerase